MAPDQVHFVTYSAYFGTTLQISIPGMFMAKTAC